MAAPSFDILGFGAIAVDDLLYVDEYPSADSKVRVNRRARQCGGLTGTALVAASRLGARCAYVGILGSDELSRFVGESLDREGVDLSHAPRRDNARPGHSTIIVGTRPTTRTIFSSIDGDMGADPDFPDEQLIGRAGALLIDHHGIEGNIRAARVARRFGVPVVADFERNPGGRFDELLLLVDHLIVSRRFAVELTGRETVEDAAGKLLEMVSRESESLPSGEGRVAVVTHGSEGCWYCESSRGGASHYPAPNVEAVDTTGCGDVFHGAYAASLAWGEPLRRRIEFATVAAALKATKPGGQDGCPTRATVDEFLDKSR